MLVLRVTKHYDGTDTITDRFTELLDGAGGDGCALTRREEESEHLTVHVKRCNKPVSTSGKLRVWTLCSSVGQKLGHFVDGGLLSTTGEEVGRKIGWVVDTLHGEVAFELLVEAFLEDGAGGHSLWKMAKVSMGLSESLEDDNLRCFQAQWRHERRP